MNRKSLVICVSGGMDSYIAYHYALDFGYLPENILCLNFDIGQPYKDKEQRAMATFGFPITTMKIDLIKPELNNVPTIENYIIPARNMIFATIAAGFGETVWIMGMKYENHPLMLDKNEAFFTNASKMLTQCIGEFTVVTSPFIEWSKTDSIIWALEHGITGEQLMKTSSCYHPTKHNCGECSLCFKRWVAMKSAGVEETFDVYPPNSEEAKRLVMNYIKAYQEQDFTHYQKDRIEETFKVLGIKL